MCVLVCVYTCVPAEHHLFHPFFLALLDHVRIRVSHHGYQHIEQQNRHEDHENGEHGFAEVRVRRVAQIRILQAEKMKSSWVGCESVISTEIFHT